MTRFLNLLAAEPDIARVPIMIDSSKWSSHRGRPEVRPGQGDRQLDQPQGGRGEVPRAGPARPPLRRGRRRDGVRRGRPGGHRPTARSPSASAPIKLLTEEVGFAPDRHHLRRQHPHRRHRAWRSTTTTPSSSSRRSASSSSCSPRRRPPAASATSRSRFRGNEAVREAMNAAFLYHAIRAGLDMGIVNAGQLQVYEEIPKDLLERVEDVLLNRRPDATERLTEFAETVKKKGKKATGKDTGLARRRRSRSGSSTPWSTASPTSSTPTSRRPGSQYDAAAPDHRRAADGRHERRRRPVRRRQDVPAAGGQERPRDEEGGRLPAAVHGGREGARAGGDRARRAARS